MKLLFRSLVATLALAACTPKNTNGGTTNPGDTTQTDQPKAEVDDSPKLTIDASVQTVDECVSDILRVLGERGFLRG